MRDRVLDRDWDNCATLPFMAKVLVGIGGGIAAFKALDLVRQLVKREHQVRVVMTQAATHFVGSVTFAGITGEAAVTDLWDPEAAGEKHVELSAWADIIVVAPATANLIARAAHGMADDAVLATLACADVPVLFAPAMHTRMWEQKATQENVTKLQARGWTQVGPVRGPLASGDVGIGRMAEPEQIAVAISNVMSDNQMRSLENVHVVVTAGPTREPIDPVRFLSNHSSGKMGYAIAAQASARGANVVLISGPTALEPPKGVQVVRVESAQQMFDATMRERVRANVFIMTAAVSDYRPEAPAHHKIKKSDGPMTLSLVRNPDILGTLGEDPERNYRLVGFALETEDVVEHAKAKLLAKNCDLVVANEAGTAFGADDNQVWLVSETDVQALPRQSKTAVASHLLDWLETHLKSHSPPSSP